MTTLSASKPQRPEIGLDTVLPGELFLATKENYPWLPKDVEVPTVEVQMLDGTTFRLGSLVGCNPTIAKIASTVPDHLAKSADSAFISSLPQVLERGASHPRVQRARWENHKTDLLKIGTSGKNPAYLFFAVDNHEDTPVVLRSGIASYNDQSRIFGVLAGVSRRRKAEG